MNLAHLPTIMLFIGYVVFWAELYVIKPEHGVTSPLATIIFVLVCCIAFRKSQLSWAENSYAVKNQFRQLSFYDKAFVCLAALITLFILGCTFYASIFPPHLMQEYDAIHYHYTLPRQHLIQGTFLHIPWAADDLFLLPINFALAPYWFMTELPNKFPQFIIFLGLIFVVINLMNHFVPNKFISKILAVCAILGSHHIGIQMGTAMLDLVMCYLFLASLDSFLRGRIFLFLIEISFFIWSKSFVPIQMALIFCTLFLAFYLLKKLIRVEMSWGFSQDVVSADIKKYKNQIKKLVAGFFILSIFIAAPFLVKSTYYAGTPLFPFSPGMFKVNKNIDYSSRHWKSIEDSSAFFMTHIKDGYGYGRSPKAFIKHFWLIAVPDKGVNNMFDYPVGLVYLLLLVPFLYMFFCSLRMRKFAIIPFFIVVYWMSWWFGSQQVRFLYIPTILMMVVVISQLRESSKIFMGALIIAMSLNALSIFRAHKGDFGYSPFDVLREKDKNLYAMSKEYIKKDANHMIELEYHDVTFAQFPVKVTQEKLPHTLSLEIGEE